jgi:hypothetical protein
VLLDCPHIPQRLKSHPAAAGQHSQSYPLAGLHLGNDHPPIDTAGYLEKFTIRFGTLLASLEFG